jgi:hypothetical protein
MLFNTEQEICMKHNNLYLKRELAQETQSKRLMWIKKSVRDK